MPADSRSDSHTSGSEREGGRGREEEGGRERGRKREGGRGREEEGGRKREGGRRREGSERRNRGRAGQREKGLQVYQGPRLRWNKFSHEILIWYQIALSKESHWTIGRH